MNKADKVKQKLIKEVVIPSLIGVLIALLFLSAVVSEGQPIEIEAAEEGALVHFASETYYLERRY